MNVILFDDHSRSALLPFTFTRPVAAIRVGILTIAEKWERHLGTNVSFLTQDYLSEKFPLKTTADNILINGKVLPDKKLVDTIKKLKQGERLMNDGEVVAIRSGNKNLRKVDDVDFSNTIEYKNPVTKLVRLYDIFVKNGQAIRDDFALLTAKRKSAKVSVTNRIINRKNFFAEPGVRMEHCIINAEDGPVYLGKNSEVMQGSIILGPFALCHDSTVRLGTKIYGDTTVGPFCKVGGEISNSVIFGYSNKAHDGFLGNSVIGEWCNLGAGTNNSNLKNNYSDVKLWDYETEDFISTGLQFCGLMMGDHSKCSINSMFNTGTVCGVSSNIFGNGFPPKYIANFSWGGAQGFSTFRIEDALEVAKKVFERRKIKFDKTEEKILRHIFAVSIQHRAW